MESTLHLTVLVGSLRQHSFNRMTLDACRDLLGHEITFSEIDLTDVPFYNADVEAAGDPPAVAALKQSILSADALLILSPEYNGSIPAVVKNALDWASSSVEGPSALSGRTVGLVATIPGRHEADGVRSHIAGVVGRNSDHFFAASHVINSIRHRLTIDPTPSDLERQDPKNGTMLGGSELGTMNPRPDLEQWLRSFMTFINDAPKGEQ